MYFLPVFLDEFRTIIPSPSTSLIQKRRFPSFDEMYCFGYL